MKTVILPGFSQKNLPWAEEVVDNLGEDTTIIHWPHWETGKVVGGWKEDKVDEISKEFEGQKINIIAKSVGTIVAMMVLIKNSEIINKVILCGIPASYFEEGNENLFEVLRNFSSQNILCVQNDNDPFASYKDIEKLIHSIKLDIEVISKPLSTHDYPYFDDFKNFFN